MNKGQGIFAGAVIAAALLFRPGTATAPSGGGGPQSGQAAAGLSSAESGKMSAEGPWLASCWYWAAVQAPALAGSTDNKQSVSDVEVDVRLNHQPVQVSEKENQDKEDPGCGDKDLSRWGFPAQGTVEGTPQVTVILAMVPDPVHTHYTMEFDRTIDAILQAAEDNGYVSSYFWLPWLTRADALKEAVSANGKEPGHDPVRERQPGLIVLKHVPTKSEDPNLPSDKYDATPANSYFKVIYLFLIAGTPTTGVDGFQLQIALQDETTIAQNWPKLDVNGQALSAQAPREIHIIGPRFSGSAAGLAAAIQAFRVDHPNVRFELAGDTSTELSLDQLRALNGIGLSGPNPVVKYHSFSNEADDTVKEVSAHLMDSGYQGARVAHLVEDNTVLGESSARIWEIASPNDRLKQWRSQNLIIRFPREISLLRNAEVEMENSMSGDTATPAPSPYLHFSAKDSGIQDSVPQFSRENTPLSQEAQLMMIARQLRMKKIQIVSIAASNVLDGIFLTRFLHRADPDIQFFLSTDLLLAREADNDPYIGALAVGPHTLLGLGGEGQAVRTNTDATSIEMYNAASYIIWSATGEPNPKGPKLQGYRNLLNGATQPLLWATSIGRDGYFPMGVLSPCASDDENFLPQIDQKANFILEDCRELDRGNVASHLRALRDRHVAVYPSLGWEALAWVVVLLCCAHGLLIFMASYWSPTTRDLAIEENDLPERRVVCINVSIAALSLLAFVVGFPGFALFRKVEIGLPAGLALSSLALSGGFSVAMSLGRTVRALRRHRSIRLQEGVVADDGYAAVPRNACRFLVALTWFGATTVAVLWYWLCSADLGPTSHLGKHAVYLEGISFSYRCVFPASGVSPVAPIFLLLMAWYVGGIFQTWRLRFSEGNRPHLTYDPGGQIQRRYIVSEQDLSGDGRLEDKGWAMHDASMRFGLCNTIECPLFVARLLRRLLDKKRVAREVVTAASGATLLLALCLKSTFISFDHFLWSIGGYLPTPYEALTALLVFPLLWISFSGWLRLVYVWSALKRDVLTRLENQPLRFAFNHLQEEGWVAMLGRAGLREQRRDLHRCIESMSQMLNLPGLKRKLHVEVRTRLSELSDRIVWRSQLLCGREKDHEEVAQRDYRLIEEIDLGLADFGRELLLHVLSDYWSREKASLVENGDAEEMPIQFRPGQRQAPRTWIPIELQAARNNRPPEVAAAEEFLAIRYMSLIRAVLANLRYLMIVVSMTFVLSIIAWNSYPFQPRQLVDWMFTGLMVLMGGGIIWVFAQMHRDPILSRLTNTRPDELGWDFYLRIVSFGAIPVLTWLAYEFPDIGSTLYRIVAPGASIFK
jgi:hypothetical protein